MGHREINELSSRALGWNKRGGNKGSTMGSYGFVASKRRCGEENNGTQYLVGSSTIFFHEVTFPSFNAQFTL